MLELYPDNEKHVSAFDFIVSDSWSKKNKPDYLYINHHIIDLNGDDILEGEGKPHYHMILSFENPVYASSLAKQLSLIQDSGDPDLQFIQAVRSMADSLLYLTHVKYEDKEHYSRDDLHGSRRLLSLYDKALIQYMEKKSVTIRDALWAFRWWVEQQKGIITADKLIRWLITTPYLKYRNERLLHQLISEHNSEVYAEHHTDKLSEIARGYITLNQNQGLLAAGSDVVPILSDEELKELGFDYDE